MNGMRKAHQMNKIESKYPFLQTACCDLHVSPGIRNADKLPKVIKTFLAARGQWVSKLS